MTLDTRHIPFPTVFNFRDIGGYATGDGQEVQWRRVYRADGIHRLSVHDLAPLGIRTVVDLRTEAEREERGFFEADEITNHHLPMFESTWEVEGVLPDQDAVAYLAERYADMLVSGPVAIAGTFALVADTDALPLVFHCAAGKDRTGVTAALLLAVLGVSDDDIAADYALSAGATEQFIEWLRAERPEAVADMQSAPTAFLASPAAAMVAFLEALRTEHGSVEAYLASVGVTDATLAAVRANLLT